MEEIKKTITPAFLNEYLRTVLKNECKLSFDEETMDKILIGLKSGIDSLIEDKYSFKFLGFYYDVYHKSPRVYQDVRTGEVDISKAHYSLKIKVPRKYQRRLKEKTRYQSNENPVISPNVTKEDLRKVKL